MAKKRFHTAPMKSKEPADLAPDKQEESVTEVDTTTVAEQEKNASAIVSGILQGNLNLEKLKRAPETPKETIDGEVIILALTSVSPGPILGGWRWADKMSSQGMVKGSRYRLPKRVAYDLADKGHAVIYSL